MAHAAPPAAGDWKRLLDDNARRALEQFEARCGRFGEHERRSISFTDAGVEVRDSEGDPDAYTVKGHAAVFNRKSLDLGGFQEIILPTAFDSVLDRSPHVLLLWDHDTRYQLASTKTNRLELRIDPRGLHYWARVVGTTSHARDLRMLMDAGEVDQSSFAFTVARDTWEIKTHGDGEETVVRTIEEVAELFDVTITAMGAYPQTDSSVVRAYAFNYAADLGHLDPGGDAEEREADTDAAPDDPADVSGSSAEHRSEDAALDDPADTEEKAVAQEAGSEERQDQERTFAEVKREARAEVAAAKTRYLRIERRTT